MMRGLIFSQQVLMELAEKGVGRQEAYVMVQRNAMMVWESNLDFMELLLADREIRQYLTEEEIREIFNLDYHVKYTDHVFDRVFGPR